jgi:hypothetical protein
MFPWLARLPVARTSAVAAVAAVAAGASALCVLCALGGCKRSSSPTPPAPSAAAAPPPSRCDAPGGSVFSLGEGQNEDDGDPMPFSVEVGQGAAFDGGFAVGAVIPDGKRGAQAAVVTLDERGGGAKIVSLGGAHGDTQPPRVAAAGAALVTALLESGAAGRRLKVGRVENGALTWGPTFEQGRDESLAFDVAVGPERAIAVWDDARDLSRGIIQVATFLQATLGSPTPVRTVSPKTADAELPRVVARPGGFWITWVARRAEKTEAPSGPGKGAKGEHGEKGADDEPDREPGEGLENRWIEAMPLDDRGAPAGAPRRITSEQGHVLTYDLRELAGGSALVVFRDDDTPSGSDGGVIMKVVLRPDGASEPVVLADRNLGVGAPAVLPGWLAVADAMHETRLAQMGPGGELLDKHESEPALGRGEPVAARGDALLVLRPRGRGVRLYVTRCRAAGSEAAVVPSANTPPEPAAPGLPPADPPVIAPGGG